MENELLKTEYSKAFDDKRKALICQSYYKYGSLKKCLAKFEETGNTEYLCDVANYAMFRFMFPQNGEYFKNTDSDGSAGIVGMSVKEMEDFKDGR